MNPPINAVQLCAVPQLPVAAGGIVYMFAVYIRKLLPCFMLRQTRFNARMPSR